MVPAGNTGQAVQDYYHYLWSTRLEQINVPQIFIDWWGPFWIALVGLSLIVFFFLYSYTFNTVHRKRERLYGPTSFAGHILERIGRPALFEYYVYVLMVAASIFYIVTQIIRGQTY